MTKTVYLAGPITGLSYGAATDWRDYASNRLMPLHALDPMRGKEYLSHVEEFTADGDAYRPINVMSSNRGIMTRDHYDVRNCDALLVNMLGAKRVSIGTVMEIAWAHVYQKPVVLVIEPEGNVHDHGMIGEATGYRVETLDEGIHIVRTLLLAYAGMRPDPVGPSDA